MIIRATAAVAASIVCLAAGHAASASDRSKEITFAAWNVQNYRTKPAVAPDGGITTPAKKAESIAAVVATLRKIEPDILGLSEMGSRRDLKDLQERLRQAGVDLPHATWVDGADKDRHLALLSRFPLTTVDHQTRSEFVLGGQKRLVQRGFLDCSIELPGGATLRVVGAHLKSRRIVPEFDQEEFRRNESLLLRRHVEGILGTKPDAPLLVFGDFNDTKNSAVVGGILGRPGRPDSLTLLPLSDRQGDQWTYRWEESDEYSRVDFIMVSETLRPLVQPRGTRIHREPRWFEASDHRPLVVSLRLAANSAP